jgi:hypothetical protein
MKDNDNQEQNTINPLRDKMKIWIKRISQIGFIFFLMKGIFWLLLPILITLKFCN